MSDLYVNLTVMVVDVSDVKYLSSELTMKL